MAIHLKVLHALFQLLESENDSELLKIPLKGWWPQERPTNPMDGPTNMVFHLLHLHHLHLHNLITSFGVARKAPKAEGWWLKRGPRPLRQSWSHRKSSLTGCTDGYIGLPPNPRSCDVHLSHREPPRPRALPSLPSLPSVPYAGPHVLVGSHLCGPPLPSSYYSRAIL